MKTVMKLQPETVISQREIKPGVTIGIKSPKSVTWAVCDESGLVIMDKNILTGEMMPSIWPNKATAERVASK